MSNYKSLVDSDGNINANYLTKELQEALEADVKFKQTDNMKKRAVKVSTDYNEFKNMVAAAHLKKLTSKEVESLSHVKKGWQKTVAQDNSSSAIILTKEIEIDQLNTQNEDIKKIFNSEVKLKPKSAMEIERDLRRISNQDEKLLYLYRVGLKRAKSLLAGGGDTDLLEQIVKLLCTRKREVLDSSRIFIELADGVSEAEISKLRSEQTCARDLVDEENEESRHGNAADAVPGTVCHAADLLMDLKLRIKWLKSIAEFEKFDLMVQFSSQELLGDAMELLNTSTSASSETARHKYQKGIKC